MNSIKKVSSRKTIFLLRRIFYNTPVMRWGVTSYIYNKVFSFGQPDSSKPINFRGTEFFVDPKDRSYLPSMVGGYYEKHELDIFEDISRYTHTFLDVGANIGMYSVLAVGQNSKIKCFAFEPVEENQALLKKNINLNGAVAKIKIIKSAVSNKSGTAVINLSDTMSGTHSLSIDRGGSSRKVRTITLDEYCKKNSVKPDLIKIDVEGHEASVFEGMPNLLKNTPTIFMEYVPELNKDMGILMKNLAKIYSYCFVVDTVHGTTKKMPIGKIDASKRYNIVLAKNKEHLKVIASYVTGKKVVKRA